MKIGYARVSTADQDTASQLDVLRAAGCDVIYQEKASTRTHRRPELEKALAALNVGDVFTVCRFDRAARSVIDLVRIVAAIEEKGANIVSLTQAIDTTTATGRMFFNVTAAFAELERDTIRERTLAGLATARKNGRVGGRPRRLRPEQIEQAAKLIDNGEEVTAVARSFNVARSTMNAALARYRAETATPTT